MENGIRAICEDDLAWKIEKKLFCYVIGYRIYIIRENLFPFDLKERSTSDEKVKKKYT